MTATKNRWMWRGSFAVLPLLFSWTMLWLSSDRGPLWLGQNSDPSYQYLLSSLLVLDGHTPQHVDHPGTTLQVLGAQVLRLSNWGSGGGNRARNILADPERAVTQIHSFLLFLTAAVIAATGVVTFERTHSWIGGFLMQLVPLLQLGTYRSALFVEPEALLVPLTLLMITLLIVRESLLEAEQARSRELSFLNLLIGFLAGAALVTKVTFAPLCLLPLAVQTSRKGAFQTAGAISLGGAVCLLPIASELPRMIRWFGGMATHTGLYGGGAEGFIDPLTYGTGVRELLLADRVFLVLLLAALTVGTAVLLTKPVNARVHRRARVLLSTAGIQLVGVLLVAKHPQPRYLVPLAISSAFNAVLVGELAMLWPARTTGHRFRGAIALAAVALAILTVADVSRFAFALRGHRDAQFTHSRAADTASRSGTRVDYYRSSSVEFALYFANNSAGRQYAHLLETLYPKRAFLNLWTGCFENFSGRLTREEILQAAPIFLVGNGGVENFPPGIALQHPPPWSLTLVQRTAEETIHRLNVTP